VGPRRPQRSVAITGLGSFVGGRIAARLLEAPNPPHVVGIDLAVPRRLEGRIAFHRVDLTEPTADSLVAEILGKERADEVLHAAFFESPYPRVEYSHEVEVIGSLHVMNAAASAGVRKLVVASTAQVYGARADNPNYLVEDAPLRGHPDAHAVRDRVEMERLLALFASRHPRMVVTSLRPCAISGPSFDSPLLRHLAGDRVTTLLGYDPLLQLLHEEDWLRAIETALERDAPGAWNLAGTGVLPLSTLLRMAGKRALPLPHPLLYRLEYLGSLSRTGDPPAAFYDYLRFLCVVDTGRARRELGFEPIYSTQEAWMSFVVSRRLRRYR
jgi:UDP-glucose 4-epimerase